MDKLSNEEIRAILRNIYEKRSSEGLWVFIKDHFGLEIPRKKICPDHDSPFDFVCAVFFQEYANIIAVANRNGGKTMNFAALDAVNSYMWDDCETATIGAIEMQAKRCYRYFARWIRVVPILVETVIASLQSMTSFKNGSIVEILIGTLAGVNAPHPQKVFVDEIELMAWNVLQEVFSMAASKGDIDAATILTSSRKFANGPMERLLEESIKRNIKVFRWCIMETVAKHDPDICRKSIFHEDCQGRCLEVEGYYPHKDAVAAKGRLDDDTWDSQWRSKKASTKGLVYPGFDPLVHIQITTPDLHAPLYLAEDFGFAEGHANVVGFFQVTPSGKKIMLDEIWIEGKIDDEIIDMVEEKLLELGFVDQKFADPEKREEYQYQFNAKVEAWYCPPEEPSKIKIRNDRGYRILTQNDPTIRKIVVGLPPIRKDLKDRMIVFDPKCIMTTWEMGKYSNKKRADGTFLNEPDKKLDNGPDMLRYFYINKYPPDLAGHFTPDRMESMDDRPITGGIRDMDF